MDSQQDTDNHSDFRYKYWAFISYSHKDKKWGDWLHRRLETYRVPKYLVGRHTERGNVPTRIFPIFRDREELPTSADLGGEITSALERSRTLIVICSPSAAKSRWVNEEVLSFKRMGRAGRIYCLIVGGEPNASDQPDSVSEECFPPALRYHVDDTGELSQQRAEPIAADIRRGSDSRRDCQLKLIAGVVGVGFDELKRRDLQRQVRRWIKISVGATVLLVLTISLAILAFMSRTEAIAQREIAREQRSRAEENFRTARATVDRFFTRVSEEELFRTHGMQPLQKKLLEDALQYYQRFLDQHDEDPELRSETASALERVGSVTDTIGDREAALNAFHRAMTIWETLFTENPSDRDIRLHLSTCLSEMSTVLWNLGRAGEALKSLQRALPLAQQLLKENPENEELASHWQTIVNNLGPYQRKSGKIEEAALTYQEAWDVWEAGEGQKPRKLGFSCDSNLTANGAPKGLLVTEVTPATAAALAGLRPGDLLMEMDGRSTVDAGTVREVIDHAKPGDNVTVRVLRDDESIELQFRLQQMVSLFAVATALNTGILCEEEFGDLAKALRWYERAREHGEANLLYLQAESGSAIDSRQFAEFQILLSSVYTHLGNLLLDEGALELAASHYNRSIALITVLADKNPSVTDYAHSLAISYSNLSAINRLMEKYDEARRFHEKCITIIERLVEHHPTIDQYRIQLGEAHHNLGMFFKQQKNFNDAYSQYEIALGIFETLRENNRNDHSLNLQVASTHRAAGSALIEQARFADAESHYSSALEIFEALVDTLPPLRKVDILESMGQVLETLATIHDKLELRDQADLDRKRAEGSWLKHLTVLQDLSSEQPEEKSLRQEFAIALNNSGTKLHSSDRNAEARKRFTRIIEIYGSPKGPDDLTDEEADLVARGYGNLGWIALVEGKLEEAIQQSTIGYSFDPRQSWIRQNLATAYLCDGRTEDAMEIFRSLQASDVNNNAFIEVLAKDFEQLRAIGVSHLEMETVLKKLGERSR